MATRKFLVNIDLDQNSLINTVIENRDSVIDGYPSTPVAGQIFYDQNASNKKPFYYDGTTWVAMSSATASSVPFSGVTTGTNTTATMTVGTGASLTVSGSGTINANRYNSNAIIALADGGTNANLTAVNGGILYSTATALAITSAGSSGNLLQSNGASAPTWISLGSIDHGSFGGLLDDDHTQYLVLAPSTAARNTIQASNISTAGLTIREAAGSSAHPLYIIENPSGVHLLAFYRLTSTDYRLYINSNAGTFNVSNTPYIKGDSHSGISAAFINISSSASFSGGAINTSAGASGTGGSITTSDGGGSIDTTGNGSIQFGIAANRITVQGVSSAAGKTLTLPNLTGTIIGAATTSTTDTDIAMATTTAGGIKFVALSGDATIVNTGALTIANNAISFAKMQDITSGTVIGRSTASTGDPEQITVQAPLTISGGNLDFDETATLGNNARVAVSKNSGATVGTRRRINFIEGTNISLTIADDAGNEEVDVTIAASGVVAAYTEIQEEGTPLTARSKLNFVGSAATAADDAGNSRTNVTFDAGLNALATYNTNGFLVQTSNDNFAGRTITAGSSKISISNGSGVSGNPSIDVSESNLTHNNIGGLTSGDPHTQYVYTTASSSSRNVIGGLSSDATTRLLRLEANYSIDVGGPYSLFEVGLTSATTQFAVKGSAGGMFCYLDGIMQIANANSIRFYGSGASSAKYIAVKSPSSLVNSTRTLTLPESTSTLPAVDLAQTWSGTQTFSSVDSLNGYSLTGRGIDRLLVASRQSATATGSGDVNIYTYSVAANLLGTTKGIRFRFILKRTTGSGNVTMKLKWGTVRFDSGGAAAGPSYVVTGELWANGATNSQTGYVLVQSISALSAANQFAQVTSFTSDTTSSVNLDLDITLSTTSDVVTIYSSLIELVEV